LGNQIIPIIPRSGWWVKEEQAVNEELLDVLTLAEQIVDKAKKQQYAWSGTWYEIDDELFEKFEEALNAYRLSQWAKGVIA
jgi:hypothetical protein